MVTLYNVRVPLVTGSQCNVYIGDINVTYFNQLRMVISRGIKNKGIDRNLMKPSEMSI